MCTLTHAARMRAIDSLEQLAVASSVSKSTSRKAAPGSPGYASGLLAVSKNIEPSQDIDAHLRGAMRGSEEVCHSRHTAPAVNRQYGATGHQQGAANRMRLPLWVLVRGDQYIDTAGQLWPAVSNDLAYLPDVKDVPDFMAAGESRAAL